jgi:hypothetical protein
VHARAIQEDRTGHQRRRARLCALSKDTPEFEQSRNERKKVEMRFAHLKINHRFERMRLRGLTGARDEFHLAAIVQNDTRKLRLAATAGLASCCVCHISAVPQTYPSWPKRLIAPTPRVPRRASEGKPNLQKIYT